MDAATLFVAGALPGLRPHPPLGSALSPAGVEGQHCNAGFLLGMYRVCEAMYCCKNYVRLHYLFEFTRALRLAPVQTDQHELFEK